MRKHTLLLAGIMALALQTLPGQSQEAEKIYHKAHLAMQGLDLPVFRMAYKGYQQIDSAQTDHLAIIDYGLPSTHKRFYIINLKKQELTHQLHVAHGKNTGNNTADAFSNTPGSQKSSMGFFLAGRTYRGKHGYSLNLHGLERGLNDNAYKRRIVIHGAWYVSKEIIQEQGRLGRSWGCPAIADEISHQVIDILKNGTCLFIYAPGYLDHSTVLGQ